MHVYVFSFSCVTLQFMSCIGCLDFDSSLGLLKSQPLEAAKGSHENDIASMDSSPSMQSSSLIAARSLFLSALSDTDRLFRRNGSAESNSATPDAQRNSSNFSIRFSKKAAEDSEDESEPVLAIKIPPAAPVPADSTEPSEAVYEPSVVVQNYMSI